MTAARRTARSDSGGRQASVVGPSGQPVTCSTIRRVGVAARVDLVQSELPRVAQAGVARVDGIARRRPGHPAATAACPLPVAAGSSSTILSAVRRASAAIVSDGLTPSAVGMRAPSAT